QHADDRDPAAHRRFEGEVDAAVDRAAHELVRAGGEEHLVGGDHAFFGVDGAANVVVRRLLAAHHLDDDVDVGVLEDFVGVGGEERAVAFGDAIFDQVAHQHLLHAQGRADTGRQTSGVGGEQAHDAATDRSAAEET